MASKTESLTVCIGALEEKGGDDGFTSSKIIGKGSSNTDTYDSLAVRTGMAGAESYAIYSFDVSAIPSDASVDSVSCSACALCTASNALQTRTLQLYSGETAKGTAKSITSSSATVYSLTDSTWTRTELNNIRLKLYGKRSSNNTITSCSLRIYGADLTVTYTYNSEKFMLKIDGVWKAASKVYKKVSGIWVEQTDLSSVVDADKRLFNGGEITS